MNIATIGTSNISNTILKAFLTIPNVHLEAVYSRSSKTAHAFAHNFKLYKIYTDMNEMLNDQKIDLIYIASPNSCHYEQTKAALLARKHVICEKPIVLSTDHLSELYEIAKQKHCFLFEAITTIHMPNFEIIKHKINEMGPIHLLMCDLTQYSSRYDQLLRGNHVNVFDPKLGGGALNDLGVYCLHFVLGLFGKPLSMNVVSNLHNRSIDTSGIVVLRYPQMNAVLSYGNDSYGKAYISMRSEQGYLEVLGPCSRLRDVIWCKDGKEMDISVSTNDQHHIYELQHFINIMEHNDSKEEQRLWNHSMLVCECLEELHRKENKI